MGILRALHLLAFTFWFGTVLYVTFVSAPVLFKGLPREQFGEVQSRLFPSYYVLGYACGAFLLATFPSLKGAGPSVGWKAAALAGMLLFTLLQGLWAGPRVSRLRIERLAMERSGDTARVEALRGAFGKAHAVSSLMNLVVVLGGMTYLVLLSREWKP
jgi:hypothetical protein